MERYDITRAIGKGTFGKVYLSKEKDDPDKKDWVIKQIHLPSRKEERARCLREVEVLDRLYHPTLNGYKESFIDKSASGSGNLKLCVVLPFCNCGSLDNLLKKHDQRGLRVQELAVLDWFAQLALGLEYLHHRKVLHRDIKPENVFLRNDVTLGCASPMSAQLGDFGLSRILDYTDEMAGTICGTPYSMSPEIFRNKPYNHKSDVWALGCVMYEMCALKVPFQAQDLKQLSQRVKHQHPPSLPSSYTAALRGLIAACLTKDLRARPSALGLACHPLLASRSAAVARFVAPPATRSHPCSPRAREDPSAAGGGRRSRSPPGAATCRPHRDDYGDQHEAAAVSPAVIQEMNLGPAAADVAAKMLLPPEEGSGGTRGAGEIQPEASAAGEREKGAPAAALLPTPLSLAERWAMQVAAVQEQEQRLQFQAHAFAEREASGWTSTDHAPAEPSAAAHTPPETRLPGIRGGKQPSPVGGPRGGPSGGSANERRAGVGGDKGGKAAGNHAAGGDHSGSELDRGDGSGSGGSMEEEANTGSAFNSETLAEGFVHSPHTVCHMCKHHRAACICHVRPGHPLYHPASSTRLDGVQKPHRHRQVDRQVDVKLADVSPSGRERLLDAAASRGAAVGWGAGAIKPPLVPVPKLDSMKSENLPQNLHAGSMSPPPPNRVGHGQGPLQPRAEMGNITAGLSLHRVAGAEIGVKGRALEMENKATRGGARAGKMDSVEEEERPVALAGGENAFTPKYPVVRTGGNLHGGYPPSVAKDHLTLQGKMVLGDPMMNGSSSRLRPLVHDLEQW